MNDDISSVASFQDFDLIDPLLKSLKKIGYETPTPIQTLTIPPLLEGKDIMGQAQTGTGKTAAFALPILSKINLKKRNPQALVLAPTRELAIQVAEAFQHYANYMKNFHVLPIYGGQSYEIQLRQLRRGVHVVVGTPGRVMDHMRRGTLNLNELEFFVLDEADEMLQMGFIDDIKWVLEQIPEDRQTALFSATIPAVIRKIAKKHLKNPEEITIKVKTTTAETINQRFWMVSGFHKLDALTRILEAETFDGMLVFVRTKTATLELSEKLEARGYSSSPLNGDLSQAHRERTVERFKKGKIDILVATDVAARGLDVDRISHVINYDIPYDTDSYVHRIGRTGRAGRSGEAILFVAPREKRLLHAIEKATRQKINKMQLPSTEKINSKRIDNFKQKITDTIALEDLGFFYQLMEQYQKEHNVPALEIASALARLFQGDKPLLLSKKERTAWTDRDEKPKRDRGGASRRGRTTKVEDGMERYRVEVGHDQGVKPGNIVGAIANEGGIESSNIGRINIFDNFSTVDLPEGMPKEILQILRKAWVSGSQLKIAKFEGEIQGRDRGRKGRSRGGSSRGKAPKGGVKNILKKKRKKKE